MLTPCLRLAYISLTSSIHLRYISDRSKEHQRRPKGSPKEKYPVAHPNLAPHSGQNLVVPSVLVPQLVQNLWVPVEAEVNDDAEADDEKT